VARNFKAKDDNDSVVSLLVGIPTQIGTNADIVDKHLREFKLSDGFYMSTRNIRFDRGDMKEDYTGYHKYCINNIPYNSSQYSIYNLEILADNAYMVNLIYSLMIELITHCQVENLTFVTIPLEIYVRFTKDDDLIASKTYYLEITSNLEPDTRPATKLHSEIYTNINFRLFYVSPDKHYKDITNEANPKGLGGFSGMAGISDVSKLVNNLISGDINTQVAIFNSGKDEVKCNADILNNDTYGDF
jgi:hypothetical protein